MTENTKREYLGVFLRSLVLYIVFIVVSFVASILFILGSGYLLDELNLPIEPVFALSTLSLMLCLYSLTRAFELYDLGARRDFLAAMGERYSLVEDLKLTFRGVISRRFYISLGVMLVLAAILPYQIGYNYLMVSINELAHLSGGLLYLLKGVVVCPGIFITVTLAKTSAHKWWIVARTTEREKLDSLKSPKFRLFLEVLKITGIYTVSFYVLPPVIMLLVSLALMLGLFSTQPWIIPVVLFIIVVPRFVRSTILLIVRAKYYKRLKRTALLCGYGVTGVKRPILSALRPTSGATLTLERDGRKYTVKLLSAVSLRKPVFINTGGFFTVKHTVSLLKITLFHLMRDIDYAFESDGMKICVFTPMPRKLFVNYGRSDTAYDDGDGGTVPTVIALGTAIRHGVKSGVRSVHGPGYISDIDRGIIKPFETGEKIGEYKFFTPAGFVSAIDNDCVER